MFVDRIWMWIEFLPVFIETLVVNIDVRVNAMLGAATDKKSVTESQILFNTESLI